MNRLARIIFPHYWECISLTATLGTWTLACWVWGAPADPLVHVAAVGLLFALNRLAAVAYEREDRAGPLRHRIGGLVLAGGIVATGGAAGLLVAAVGWACVVRAGGLSAQAGMVGLPSLEWMGPEFRAVGWLGVVMGIGLVVDGYLRGYRRLEVTRLDVTLPGLPPALDGFRIVQLSDLHLGPIADRRSLRAAFDRAVDEAPDLIVVTGDVIDTPRGDATHWLPELRRLRAPHGVVAILGNHDSEVGLDRVEAALRAATDWTVLRDDVHRVDAGGGSLYVVGLEFRRTPHEGDAVATLAATLPPESPALLLAHHPNAFPAAAAAGFALTLAGHTHGGQVAVPFAPRWNPARLLMTSYDAGTFIEGDALLHVNRGLGQTGQRVRIAVAREITVLTLRSPDSASS